MVKWALVVFCILLAAGNALADAPPVVEETRVHHAPVASADESKPLTIDARVERPDRAKRVLLVYAGASGVRELPFERAPDKGESAFSAEIPATFVAIFENFRLEIVDISDSTLKSCAVPFTIRNLR